jgi:hypothetical protein
MGYQHARPFRFLGESRIILDKHSARSSVWGLLEHPARAANTLIYADYCEY